MKKKQNKTQKEKKNRKLSQRNKNAGIRFNKDVRFIGIQFIKKYGSEKRNSVKHNINHTKKMKRKL